MKSLMNIPCVMTGMTKTSRGKLALLVLAACAMALSGLIFSRTAKAQATTIKQNITTPFAATVTSCSGELVDITGKAHLIFRGTFDSSGGTHIKFHINENGQGEGRTSGEDYTFGQVFNAELNTSGPPPAETTQTFTTKLNTTGPDNNAFVKTTFHITINANGEITSTVDKVEAECR